MSGIALALVLIGAATVSKALMGIILYLDKPCKEVRKR